MPQDWLPSKDQDLDAFGLNFDTLITASPGTYGVDAATAAAFHTQRLDFTTKLATATNPGTRTKATVADKDASKALLKSLLRQDAAVVQSTASVSNVNKTALGLPIRTVTPSPIPAPATYPVLSIAPSGSLLQTLRFADSATPASRRKPTGAIALELRAQVSATPLTDPSAIAFKMLSTRNPQPISFDSADAGHVCYYSARWVTRKGLPGPWSAIVPVGVAA